MFKPDEIFYEKAIKGYDLGIQLLKQYHDVPKKEIQTHNNIDELRTLPNSEFPSLKRKLIIGVRKTHKYSPNHKVSDFLVPYTSSRMHRLLPILLSRLPLREMFLPSFIRKSRANVRKNNKNRKCFS